MFFAAGLPGTPSSSPSHRAEKSRVLSRFSWPSLRLEIELLGLLSGGAFTGVVGRRVEARTVASRSASKAPRSRSGDFRFRSAGILVRMRRGEACGKHSPRIVASWAGGGWCLSVSRVHRVRHGHVEHKAASHGHFLLLYVCHPQRYYLHGEGQV